LAKERSARIIYLKAFTVDQDPYAWRRNPFEIEGQITISNNRKDYLVPPGLIPSLGRSITPFHLSH
jgi:hypothetical protein